MGWANPGNIKAVLTDNVSEAIETLREELAKAILYWDPKVDLKDFSFNISENEVDEDGRFYTAFCTSIGTNYKIHEKN
jgi:phage baseplate assembly protein W